MSQRTIADATFALETVAGLSNADRRVAQGEIEEAKRQASASANELADARVAEVAALRDEALAELCAVRDAYGELASEAELGRITVAECDRRLNNLRARQRAAERHIARTSEPWRSSRLWRKTRSHTATRCSPSTRSSVPISLSRKGPVMESKEVLRLEDENRLLAAEAAVGRAEVEDLERAWFYKAVDSPQAHEGRHLVLELDRYRRDAALRSTPYWHQELAGLKIEGAVYGWRRDYGEWPSRMNLADRLATETGLSVRRAEKKILDIVNNPSPEVYVYAMRAARMQEVLDDEDYGVGRWNPDGERDLRFYVLAEGQARHARAYSTHYVAERVA